MPALARHLLFHASLALALVATQVIYAPARWINSDNNWHFRLARDVVASVPVYWSGVDANRLFPDLLFSIVAIVLPWGSQFTVWLLYYYSIYVIVLYGSVCYLSNALFTSVTERRYFVLFSISALSLFLWAAPFWDNWLVIPGNHGGALPACILALALLLTTDREARFSWWRAALFIVLATATIASNRLLLIAFFVPLGLALLLVWAVERVGSPILADQGGDSRPAFSGPRLLSLATLVGIGSAAGLTAWRVVSDLAWHKLVAHGDTPKYPTPPYLDWLAMRLETTRAALAATPGEVGWDVWVGLGLLSLTVPAGVLAFAGFLRGKPLASHRQGRLILIACCGGAAALTLIFVLITINLTGAWAWQFRYLTIPAMVAILALASLAVPRRPDPARRQPWLTVGVVMLMVASATIAAAGRSPVLVAEEKAFVPALRRLEELVRSHSPSPDPVLRGFSEYWVANRITARSTALHVDTLEPEKARFRLYNNNAVNLCRKGHFFVVQDIGNNQPGTSMLMKEFGEPIAREVFEIPWAWPVNGVLSLVSKSVLVLIFDPAVVEARILEPSREEAARLFPSFRCSS